MNILTCTFLLCIFAGNLFHWEASGSEQISAKIFLHLDRDAYRPGEQIFFKAYVIDPLTNLPSTKTNALQIELTSNDGNVILSKTHIFTGGTGNSFLKLPDQVPSGRFLIRAYASPAGYSDNQLSFQKEITVINSGLDYEQLSRSQEWLQKKIDIKFFPESGYLVDSVLSVVAFNVEDESGKGCDVTLKLFTDSGNLVAEFNSINLGMGRFSIVPMPGYRYYALVKGTDGKETGSVLPQSYPTGLTMSTSVYSNNMLSLVFRTNSLTLPSLAGKAFRAEISSDNVISKTILVRPDSLLTNYLVPLDSLPRGILKVTLSDDNGLPICERLIYNAEKSNIQLNIKADKEEYDPLEKVNLEISVKGDSLYSGKAKLSLAVSDSRVTNSSAAFVSSIASWIFLESGIQGPVEEPGWYFNKLNRYRFQFIDLLLMTQKLPDKKSGYKTLDRYKNKNLKIDSKSFIPEIFNTIHWEPEISIPVNTNVSYSYNNTKQSGIKIITVEGITDDGIPVTARVTYYVK